MNWKTFTKEYIKFNPFSVLKVYSRSTGKPFEGDGCLSCSHSLRGAYPYENYLKCTF